MQRTRKSRVKFVGVVGKFQRQMAGQFANAAADHGTLYFKEEHYEQFD